MLLCYKNSYGNGAYFNQLVLQTKCVQNKLGPSGESWPKVCPKFILQGSKLLHYLGIQSSSPDRRIPATAAGKLPCQMADMIENTTVSDP